MNATSGDSEVVRLTRAQVREVDRRAIEQYGIPGIVLMENAARSAADLASTLAQPDDPILIICGGGNNGGDGLALARHLHNRGYTRLRIATAFDPARLKGDALTNWRVTQAMSLSTLTATPTSLLDPPPTLLVDALFGTGLDRPPAGPHANLIDALNHHPPSTTVLAIDLPSGLDCDTGHPLGPCVRADHTITFVAEKVGFANPAARPYLGRITVGDIGCPRELIAAIRCQH